MATIIYGIKNCDTMKKARAWLDKHGVDYAFHDYKTAGIEREKLERWAKKVGWETLLNRAGTTFRKLPDKDKDGLTEKKAVALMLKQPSMIKRPVLELGGGKLLVGLRAGILQGRVLAYDREGLATRRSGHNVALCRVHAHRCCIAIIGENIRADFSGWHWPAEIEALNLIGIGLVKEIDLVERFHAFDSDSHVHFATQRDDRFHHGFNVAARFFEALHEAAVNLDLVEREFPKVAQARISRAEIVHHN